MPVCVSSSVTACMGKGVQGRMAYFNAAHPQYCPQFKRLQDAASDLKIMTKLLLNLLEIQPLHTRFRTDLDMN